MNAALTELEARLSDVESQLDFVAIAVRLRPRINGVIRWEAGGDEVGLAKQFMNQKGVTIEGIYGGLLVRVLGAFERFVRRCVAENLLRQTALAKQYDLLPEALRDKHLVLTGKLLSSLQTPSDHIVFSPNDLVSRLATCHSGASAFELNSVAFEATVTSASPIVIERALENVGCSNWWDEVGGAENIEDILECHGAGPRAAGKLARERLRELWKWRNGIAHGGDSEVVVSEQDLRRHLGFVRCLSHALEVVTR
jgi:hypothetical protein